MAELDPREPTKFMAVRRLASESWPGFLLAVAYTVWDWMSSTPRPPLSQLVGKFSAAFFFVMWVIGQFIRVSKQLRLEYNLDDIRNTVNHIKDTLVKTNLSDLHEIPQVPATPALAASASASGVTETAESPAATLAPVSAKRVTAPPPSASGLAAEVAGRALITEAEAAAQAGAYRASLMVAGAALEEAAREFGRSRGIAADDTVPLRKIFSAARPMLGHKLTNDLNELWDIRNRVVHGRLDEKKAASIAPEILDTLRRAVGILLEGAKHEKYTGIPCTRCGYPAIGSGGAQNVCGNCGYIECD